MNFDLSRSDVESLLAGFLAGTLGVEFGTRLIAVSELPAPCRTHVRAAVASGHAWIAWTTPCGPMAAWGVYDIQGSRQINAYLLSSGGVYRAVTTRCGVTATPKRPTDWVVGRGRHNEPR